MTKLWSICRNTFVQTIRQPIYSVLILVTFAVLAMNVPLSNWAISEEADYHTTDQKMMESLGLSTLLVAGLLISAFSASGVLSREIEDRTALTVISKPVSRPTFVLGKYAGVSAAVTLAVYLSALAFLMTVRHKVMPTASDEPDWPVIVMGVSAVALAILTALLGNYFFGWPFLSTGVWSATIFMSLAMGLISFIGKEWTVVPVSQTFGQDIHPQLLLGLAMMFLATMIFTAVAVATSTRFGQVMTLLVCGVVLFAGSMHGFLFAQWGNKLLVARMLGWVFPKLPLFFPIDALQMDKAIPPSYVAWLAVYCLLYSAAAVALGMALFQTRELEAQGTSTGMPRLVGLLARLGRLTAVAIGLIGLEGLLVGLLVALPRKLASLGVSFLAGDLLGGFQPIVPVWAAGLIAVAAAAWAFWGQFGRGAPWTYWVALIAVIGSLLARVTLVHLGWPIDLSPARWPVQAAMATILIAAVGVVLVLPAARHHFKST